MRQLNNTHEVSDHAGVASRHERSRNSLPIDVIIPVYGDYAATKRCIVSVLCAPVTCRHEVVVINDASPDPQITAYLRQLASEQRITLLENEVNRGFVYTVNRGMQLHTDRDVLLLNSDTEVANNWLDRLCHCAYSRGNIATVTPFSNNATICSYPKICASNTLPAGYSVAQLDQLFATVNKHASVCIPTAVGFCMFIKRSCIAAVGYFNEELFGKGYGEENDFCLRAVQQGWSHVIAGDVWVFHEGSVSFGAAKQQRVEHAMRVIDQLYPDYHAIVQAFILRDELALLRYQVDIRRLQQSPLPTYVLVTHDRAGGVHKHIYDLVDYFGTQLNFLLLKPERNTHVSIQWLNQGEVLKLEVNIGQHLDELIQLLVALRITRFHIHHTLGWGNALWQIIAALRLPYDVTIHDYYTFCPQISLTTEAERYCGEPDVAGCQRCVQQRAPTRDLDILAWRRDYQLRLQQAARVFAPSMAVLRSMQKHFTPINVLYAPHLERGESLTDTPRVARLTSQQPLKILVLGALSVMKGADVLEACALLAKKQQLPLEFHLLGYAYRIVKISPKANLYVHGDYADSTCAALIAEINPHLAWFPSLWPETYSYTLSACLQARLPIVTTDLGAQPERISGRAWSFIKSWQTTPEQWVEFFVQLKRDYFQTEVVPERTASCIVDVDRFSYQDAYCIGGEKKSAVPDATKLLIKLLSAQTRARRTLAVTMRQRIYVLLCRIYGRVGRFIPKVVLERCKVVFQKLLLN